MIATFKGVQSKAFDTFNHRILLSKLNHYGIQGTILNWFTSFLQDRKLFVSVDGKKSEAKNISTGVPQGAELTTILFNPYIDRF